MRLAHLQKSFQVAVLTGETEVVAAILPSRRLNSAARLAIYQDAYRLRLTEFLANDYPALAAVLGDEDFAALASAYIDATPSLHRNARWYGTRLPDFLAAQPPWSELRIFADLAAFERALADAFDAADSPGLGADALASLSEGERPRLRLDFAPSVSVLSLAKQTGALYEAVIEGAEPTMPDGGDEETILVWRDATLSPVYRILEADEASALSVARSGATLADICALLALRHTEVTAAHMAALFLARWFGDGLVTAIACR